MTVTYKHSLLRRREKILNREALILRVARKLLKKKGYIGLTMDRIAVATRLSKATLYRHFASKEEVIMGLAIENARQRVKYTEKAASFAGCPRERYIAVRVFAEKIYPPHLEVELILYTNAIRAKTSPELQEALFDEERRIFRLMCEIVVDGIKAGDLVLPDGARAEDLAYCSWSLFFGGFTLRLADVPLERVGGLSRNPGKDFLGRYAAAALDGLGWRPLSSEWNYKATEARIKHCFSADLASNEEVPGQTN